MVIKVEDLYKKYGPMVLRRCRTLLKDETQSVEAMQDTFVYLVLNSEMLKDEAPSIVLYRTATNVCFNKIRSDNGLTGSHKGEQHQQDMSQTDERSDNLHLSA